MSRKGLSLQRWDSVVLILLGIGLASCYQNHRANNHSIDVVSRTVISGSINNDAVKGRVSATLNTGRGGSSTCEFEQLPASFTPGTFATHT
jgi:hypothetical protein